MGRVALVAVSHSKGLADGVVELAAQMAADVRVVGVGGTDDGRIGTSFDAVEAAVTDLLDDAEVTGVVLVADLGSAAMTIDSVLEMHDDEPVRHASGPLVEGVVAAAVEAQGGGDLAAVAGAVAAAARSLVESAGGDDAGPAGADGAEVSTGDSDDDAGSAPAGDAVTETVVIEDPMGMHARPAAAIATTAAGFTAAVTIDGADARSVLALMAKNIKAGTELTVQGTGADAAEAVAAVVKVIADATG
ncbi:dihydroxyacetone kinase phosphoryl donor subunit DhaM [Georgenia sp. Z1344]|uniref:dihydroxyacetone kinase phosphoryl donor subunit DhaM n=1 Tax=Georgenia sp. Z1344 TaxID=3416706 RepID=UPI003CF7C601